MKLTLDSLKKTGAFVSRQPVLKTIKWRHGGEDFEAEVYILPMSFATARSDFAALASDLDGMAARIASHVLDEAGNPVFTVGDITGDADPEHGPLNYDLTVALFNAIGEVGGLGKRQAKSTKKPKSGTS